MRPNIKVGDRWACLTIISEGNSELEAYEGRGRNYYVLRCLCGHEFRQFRHEWPGKRQLRDCGCGIADEREGVIVNVSVNMPLKVRLDVKEYADRQDTSFSRAASELMQYGLLYVDYQKVRQEVEGVDSEVSDEG